MIFCKIWQRLEKGLKGDFEKKMEVLNEITSSFVHDKKTKLIWIVSKGFRKADFKKYSIEERVRWVFDHFAEDEILMTSSFGSSSALLLHLIHKISPNHPIYFLNTGFHFEETKAYKEKLQAQLGLNVKTIGALENKHRFTAENYTYQHNQDLCCFINKVEPLSALRESHKIWLSGLFKYPEREPQATDFFRSKKMIF